MKAMVCLVGENPLPIYLGIRQFAAYDTEIILVHSSGPRGTGRIAIPIAKEVDKLGYKKVSTKNLTDPYSPVKVLEDMQKIAEQHPDAVLNYTGGTKVMSTFAVLAWNLGANFENSFYLEEGGGANDLGQFHFSDGSVPVELNVAMTLADLCALHEVTLKRPDTYPSYSHKDLLNIWEQVKLNGKEDYFRLPERFNSDKAQYEDLLRQYSRKTDTWLTAGYWHMFLQLLEHDTRSKWLQKQIPDTFHVYKQERYPYHCLSDFCKQVEFVRGTWLEAFMLEILRSLDKDNTAPFSFGVSPAKQLVTEIRAGQEFTFRKQLFESDLTLVVNHCLRYISVTTSGNVKTCKGKMFEAIHRSQQIGGGMARSCVITLLNKDGVNNCRQSVETERHQIFGIEDIKAWTGASRTSLYNFLTK